MLNPTSCVPLPSSLVSLRLPRQASSVFRLPPFGRSSRLGRNYSPRLLPVILHFISVFRFSPSRKGFCFSPFHFRLPSSVFRLPPFGRGSRLGRNYSPRLLPVILHFISVFRFSPSRKGFCFSPFHFRLPSSVSRLPPFGRGSCLFPLTSQPKKSQKKIHITSITLCKQILCM
jgi:hypothetical protein